MKKLCDNCKLDLIKFKVKTKGKPLKISKLLLKILPITFCGECNQKQFLIPVKFLKKE